ncbi:MAG: feruloyl esterase [Sphingomonadales bacterium 32-68-7]|nr:MAG: feruloyl esterase [Sphingomonadales bacterium 32-68-7]
MTPLKLLLAAAVAAALPATASAQGQIPDCDRACLIKLADDYTAADVVAAGAFRQPAPPGAPPPGVGAGAYGNLPEFCRVQATLTPTSDSDIKVEVWLPTDGWNGKFVGVGNGIWAGQITYSALAETLARGYAVASTDTGHTGNGLTAEWAVGHPEKLVDFGHRAVHEMTVTAKSAIRALYGRAPQHSFWNSCSTGGRQGLMAAHRYPNDYDAISAMAPANPMTTLMTQSMWAGWQPQRAPGAALPMPKLTLLHRAAVGSCDRLDGAEDGLIGRPEACRFDPAMIQCKPGEDAPTCLSEAQVGTAKALYDGIRDPAGKLLAPGWPVGSEMQLGVVAGGPTPFPVALTYFSMLVFGNRPGWDWKSFDYVRDLEAGRAYGAEILDVPSDGLRAFFARGGKLLMSHGWTDGLIPATNALAFREGLLRALPAGQARDQYRLFMVPGMDHCGGGAGASQFDTLGALDAWTASGRAPDTLLATRPSATGGPPGAAPATPRPPMTRPLCPYPAYARYNGSGDINDAANFACVAPS